MTPSFPAYPDDITVAQSLMATLLRNIQLEDCTTQGFGFLRFYIPQRTPDPSVRVNVWHSSLRADPAPSDIHDHPWDFTSIVLAGVLVNHRYTSATSRGTLFSSEPVVDTKLLNVARLQPGEGGGLVCDPTLERWAQHRPETYRVGDKYMQDANEVHRTEFIDGTVTMNWRWRRGNPDLAHVLWPQGEEWVSAEPRPTTATELVTVRRAALELLL